VANANDTVKWFGLFCLSHAHTGRLSWTDAEETMDYWVRAATAGDDWWIVWAGAVFRISPGLYWWLSAFFEINLVCEDFNYNYCKQSL